MERVKLRIEGMSCRACSDGIQSQLAKEEGVGTIEINGVTGRGRVAFDPLKISQEKIAELITSYGYPAYLHDEKAQDLAALSDLKRRFFISLPLFLAILILHFSGPNEPIYLYLQFFLASIVQFYCGARFYAAIPTLWRTHSVDMNLLIVLGTSAAYIYSLLSLFSPWLAVQGMAGNYFEGSSAIITFVLLGEWIKAKAKRASVDSVLLLAQLLPNQVSVLRGGREVPLGIHEVQKGDVCVIRAGEKVPLDGRILWGEAEIDSSHVSGEYLPLHKKEGDSLLGGSLVLNGLIRMVAQKRARESLLYEMVDLLEEAQDRKVPIGEFADKIASVFVPTVVGIACVTFVVWMGLEGVWEHALLALIAVLVISCPCALGLATPISIVTAISRAAREGILLKNPQIIELGQSIRRVVFDKTGTLTKGELSVKRVHFFSSIPPNFFGYLEALERSGIHPVSLAFVRYLEGQIHALETPLEVKNHIGMGLEGRFSQGVLLVGNGALLKQYGIILEEEILQVVERDFATLTTIYVVFEGEVKAVFGLQDTLREGAKETIAWLQSKGIEPVILSGDSQTAVRTMADELGVKHYLAEVLPKEKHLEIHALKQSGGVMFVGDGINDALALKEATIGLALASGTSLAQESGDVLLMRQDLRGVVDLLQLSWDALANIKRGLFFAYLYNALLIPVAAGVLYPFYGILLQPAFAGAAMALSSLSVVGNALLLRRWKRPALPREGSL